MHIICACCFVFSSRRRHTRCALVTGVQTCALPIYAVWRPVLAVLDWIRSKVDGGCRFVPLQDVPIDEVIPARWRSSVIDDDGREIGIASCRERVCRYV